MQRDLGGTATVLRGFARAVQRLENARVHVVAHLERRGDESFAVLVRNFDPAGRGRSCGMRRGIERGRMRRGNLSAAKARPPPISPSPLLGWRNADLATVRS